MRSYILNPGLFGHLRELAQGRCEPWRTGGHAWSATNTASEKVSLPSKNEICKNKDRNRVINNSDYVYEDEPEKILLHKKKMLIVKI